MTFVEFFNENVTPVRVRSRKDSRLMRFIGGCLGILRWFGADVPSKQEFMENYTTTIGSTIYSDNWPDQVTTLVVHELCHVLQFLESRMKSRYLLSPTWRIFFETECVQAEILCFPDLDRGEKWTKRRVGQFVRYWINEKLVKYALAKRLDELGEDDLRPNAKKVYEAYILWKHQP